MAGPTILTLHEPDGVRPLIRRPSLRLGAVILLLFVVVAMSRPWPLLGLSALLLVAIRICRIPWPLLLRRILLLLPFGAGTALLVPYQLPGHVVWDGFGITATREGIDRAVLLLLKLGCANLLITYLLAVTPLFALLRTLRRFGVPALLLDIVMMTMRYFILLREEASSMLRAQRSRGLMLERRFWTGRTYLRFGQFVGALFLRAYHRSERIYAAMTARGGGIPSMGGREAGGTGKRGMGGNLVEARGLSYSYGDYRALDGISFDIPAGAKVALMGPNGAGKSTLISILNGLEGAAGGELRMFGEPMTERSRSRLRGRVGVVYQDPDDQIFSTTVEEDVAFGPLNLGMPREVIMERVDRALGSVGMREHRHRSPFELSYGQKRRVAIAGVLAMMPELLILDEPMSFLDPRGRDELQALLESMHLMGMTVMVATHDVDFAAEWADVVLLLKDGRLLASGSAELLFDDELIEKASLHLPRLARPFRLLQGVGHSRPRNVRDAAQLIWKLLRRGPEPSDSAGRTAVSSRYYK